MNSHRGIYSATLALLPMVALAGAVPTIAATSDQTAPAAAASPDGRGDWHRHGHPMGPFGVAGGMMKVLRDLNLSDSQKEQIHTIFAGMHKQMEVGPARASLPICRPSATRRSAVCGGRAGGADTRSGAHPPLSEAQQQALRGVDPAAAGAASAIACRDAAAHGGASGRTGAR